MPCCCASTAPYRLAVGPPIAGDERAGLLRVARYSARAPVAELRLRYHAERAEVEWVSDAREGPFAGVHRLAALEFVARGVDHVPERYETRVRYDGAYATRRRVWWPRRGIVRVPAAKVEPAAPGSADDGPALSARKRRWVEWLRRVYAVEVAVGPRCGGAMRILAFVTEPAVIRRILAHLERRGVEAWLGVCPSKGVHEKPTSTDDPESTIASHRD